MSDNQAAGTNFRMDSLIELPIESSLLREIVEKTKDWCLMHGACMRNKLKYDEDSLRFAPFVLIPTPFPREQFNRAVNLQVPLNELMHKVAHDRLFLTECLKDTVQVDEFTGNLFKIYETVCEEGITQVNTCKKTSYSLIPYPFLFLWYIENGK